MNSDLMTDLMAHAMTALLGSGERWKEWPNRDVPLAHAFLWTFSVFSLLASCV